MASWMFRLPRDKASTKVLLPAPRVRLALEALEARLTPSATVQPNLTLLASPAASSLAAAPYSPAEIQAAYGISSLLGQNVNGQGQTIAIVDAYNDPNILADANLFSSHYGLPTFTAGGPTLNVVNETGGGSLPAKNAGWDTEISLDVEWAHAVAPGANILLVEATSASDADLMSAVAYAAQHANVVSMSWGGSEFKGETAYDTSAYFNRTNVTFVASAGDSGANGGPEWPSSSPYVLAVGGTSLKITATTTAGVTTYAFASQTTWSGGGGGISAYEGTPSYQNGVQSHGARTAPDVAYDANPSTGVSIYDSIPDQGYVGWSGVGGTSAGAPQWAAVVALADQVRGAPLNTAQVEGTLYNSTQTLSAVYNSGTYNTEFRDVTTGSNGYAAGKGYDLATGLGTPQVAAIVPALAGTTVSSSFIQAAAPTHGGGRGSGHTPLVVLDVIGFTATLPAAALTPGVASVQVTAPSFAPVVAVPAVVPAASAAAFGGAWISGGGGGPSLGGADDSTTGQPAEAPAAAATLDDVPLLGPVFTEAVRRLNQARDAVPPGLWQIAPASHPASPMPPAATPQQGPQGKLESWTIPLGDAGASALPFAVGLCAAGLEYETRRRRERLPFKPQ